MKIKNVILSMLAIFVAISTQAKITMSPIFSDNMVLQRNKAAAVFGEASPNSTVKVSFAGQTVESKADSKGNWIVKLNPMKASKENRTMSISDSEGDKIEIKNVLVGEVWLCSGQSNMDCTIWGNNPRYRTQNGGLVNQLINFDNIRFVIIDNKFSVDPLKEANMKWELLVAGNPKAAKLSACAAFFGIQLYQSLGIPIALIDASWGGTNIEPWIPKSGYASVPSLEKYYKETNNLKREYTAKELEEIKNKKRRNTLYFQPTVIFNAMVNPFVPYTLQGAIWYQGCANLAQTDYAEKMHALYNGWAKEFNNPDFQFYFVQLAPYKYPDTKDKKNTERDRLCTTWNQQSKFAAEEKNAWMAVINDVGDLYDVHPYDKQTVGLRLAALALSHTYGMKNIKADAPTIRTAKINGKKVVMDFDNVTQFYVRSHNRPDGDVVHYVEIAGKDGNFVPANVKIEKASMTAEADSVANPKFVRFLHVPLSQCNVFNENGLPVSSFNIDLSK